MAQRVVRSGRASIKQACQAFGVSVTCYRYQPRLSSENAEIADHLIRLTHNQRNWGFGLCFLYLRNVKGYRWNHKRVYRIYRELELNMRIKPRKRIVREKPEPLAVPEAINHCWSIDFMPGRVGTINSPFWMTGGCVTRSSFHGTSSISISMMRKLGMAAHRWALIRVDMWP